MIPDAELDALAFDRESDRSERKAAPSDKDRICQAICAFANDLPGHRQAGVVLVGLDDAGQSSGLPITDELLKDLAAIRSDGNIQPLPNIAVQTRMVGGSPVAVVEVQPFLKLRQMRQQLANHRLSRWAPGHSRLLLHRRLPSRSPD